MLTQTKQAPQTSLKVCVENLKEDEIRTAIAYIMAQSAGQTILIHQPSPRLAEIIMWIDSIKDSRTRDKLALFLMEKVAPKKPSRIREGRFQGKLNR